MAAPPHPASRLPAPKVAADPDFRSLALPVTRAHLRNERLGPAFVDYMNGWKGFVVQEEAEAVSA